MLHPVSPPAAAASSTSPSTPEGRPWDAAPPASPGAQPAQAPDEDEEVDFKYAMVRDPIVGVEITISDENGPGAREPIPLKSPDSMTPAQREKHNLTHLPPHPGCPFCAQNRTPNVGHSPLTRA